MSYYFYGDDMKSRYFLPLILAILVGFLSARIVYALYNTNSKEKYNAFILEVNKDNNFFRKENKNNYYYIDNKEKIYCAITTKINNLNKIKKIYDSKKINTSIKKVYITNTEFINSLEQYDILLSNAYKESDLLSITKVILSSYEDVVLNI